MREATLEIRDIDTLRNLEWNPRTVKKTEFERLTRKIKARLEMHGEMGAQFKPVIITADGEVLGGNTRLRVYRELGIRNVICSVVEAETQEEKAKYMLSDNDTAGYSKKEEVLKLVQANPELPWGDFAVHFGMSLSVSDVVGKFAPDYGVNDADLDEYLGKNVQKIILTYRDEFKATLTSLVRIMEKEKLQDTTQAVLFLLRKYYGQNA